MFICLGAIEHYNPILDDLGSLQLVGVMGIRAQLKNFQMTIVDFGIFENFFNNNLL